MPLVFLALVILNIAAITVSWRKQRPGRDSGLQSGGLVISRLALAVVDGLVIGLLSWMMCIFQPHGYLVIADSQKQGRGRLGRSFFSPEHTGVYITYILRPKMTDEKSESVSCLVMSNS